MKRVPLIIFGAGNVGRALLRQLLDSAGLHAARDEVAFRITAWCDRDGALVDQKGLWPDALSDALASKASGIRLAETEHGSHQSDLEAIVDVAGQDGAIVVDVTATDATIPALQLAVGRGYAGVTANEIPLSGSLSVLESLVQGLRFRYESTVGSAVPVIETTLGLIRAKDEIVSIKGVLSGTLGLLFAQLQTGKPF